MVKKFSVLITVFLLFSLCGCALTQKGTSLLAFCERMNELNDDYNASPSGYINDEKGKSLTKFFKFNENEIMLRFNYDSEKNLTVMHIVFDELNENNTKEWEFIKNSISAFIANDTVYSDLLLEIQFDNSIYIKDINSKKANIGNTEMIIDVTDTGTVISVFQNNP